jgi:hypothetical protein
MPLNIIASLALNILSTYYLVVNSKLSTGSLATLIPLPAVISIAWPVPLVLSMTIPRPAPVLEIKISSFPATLGITKEPFLIPI